MLRDYPWVCSYSHRHQMITQQQPKGPQGSPRDRHPAKHRFGPICTVVGKTWVTNSHHCASFWTEVPFHFSSSV